MSNSQTIVRKVRGGSDSADHRFIILSETETPQHGFMFRQVGGEMSIAEVCAALMTHGISENDAYTLLNEAVANSESA